MKKLVLAAAFLAASLPAFGGYSYYRPIVVSHLKVFNSTQSNFPMMVAGTVADLATVANGGLVTNINGYDIAFASDSAGVTRLDYERVSYNATTGAVEFHVRVPSISTSVDTTIYILFGNAAVTTDQSNKTGVWDSNYKLVCHFGDGTTLDVTDSTSNGNNGTNNGGTAVAGLVGSGAMNAVAASSQYVNFGNNSSLNLTTEITMEAVAKPATLPGGGNFPMVISKFVSNNGYELILHDSSGRSSNAFYGQFVTSGTYSVAPTDFGVSATAGVATFLTSTTTATSGSNAAMYLNGLIPGGSLFYQGGSSGAGSSSANLNVGRRQDGTFYFNGVIDEVRISNIHRESDWIHTTYNNLSSPATFYTIGARGTVPSVSGAAHVIGAQVQGQGSVY